MRLWRLAAAAFAERFDGGYGLAHAGRWNSRGWRLTYCASGPALCLLEKLVHVDSPALLPDGLRLVCYEAPDDILIEVREPEDLPAGWQRDETVTRAIGDAWAEAAAAALLRVPSVIVPVGGASDRNFVVNHDHAAAGRIAVRSIEAFELDHRLLPA